MLLLEIPLKQSSGFGCYRHEWFKPLFCGLPLKKKHCWENILSRNVNHTPTNNSPSNILLCNSQFQSYGQKIQRSRRQFLEELLSINGLTMQSCLQHPIMFYFSDIFLTLNLFLLYIWKRNINQKPTNNSPPSVLCANG